LSTSSSSEQGFPLFPAGLAWLGLLSVLVGRGMAQALPGTIAGYDTWVSMCLTFGAFCSQLLAVVGATLAIRSALWLVLQPRHSERKHVPGWQKSFGVGAKALLGCCALFVSAVVFVAAQPRVIAFGPIALTLLSCCVSLLLGVSASMALESRATRAISLVAVHAALASLVHTLARLTAYQGSLEGSLGQFDFARGLSTGASIAEWLLVAVAGTWLWRNSDALARAVTSVLIVCAPAILWNPPHSGLRLALVRSVEQLCPHPDPFLPVSLRFTVELIIVALAFGAVVNNRGPRLGGLVVCFALLGRSSADTPLGALLLLLASLALLVMIALESSPLLSTSSDQPSQPPATTSVHV
jgi:hypothetical protein